MKSTSKTQIDRLGNRLRKGEAGDTELRQLDDFRRSFAGAYDEVVATIRKVAQREPTGRPAKTITSIVEKLRRETIRLSQMQDIAGCRLVVRDVLSQDRVAAQLMVGLPSAVLVDRRKQPSYGYRAIHIIATAQGKPVEIQIRTELQHLWAQLSEKLSDVFDPALKYGGGNREAQQLMSEASTLIGELEVMEFVIGIREQALRGAPDLREEHELAAEKLAAMKKGFGQVLKRAVAVLGAIPRRQTGE